jgi:hypothetical protein
VLSDACAGTCGAPYGVSEVKSLRSGNQVGQFTYDFPI